jgi:mRNA-degrading endonuclease RelE of RelBE toxin-antitoxin system
MNWIVRVAEDAQTFIESLPAKTARQLNRSIVQMKQDPFQGDVKALQGKEWKGYYRKRTGDYRIIFFPHREQHIVDVALVVLRSEKTYR